ncbi:MAG: SGNH/GDSL hydrolase family protein [Aquihabitans sp.]
MRSTLPSRPSARRARVLLAAAVVVTGLAASGCSSDDAGAAAGSTTSEPTAATPSTATSTATSTTAAPSGPARTVAIVADSEVPSEVADRLASTPGIEVTSRVTQPGARMEHLDIALDRALAEQPDALVYSGGTNDVAPLGVSGMLDALEPRLTKAKAATCVVFIVPAVDTTTLDGAAKDQADQLLNAFGDVVGTWGMQVVSYPEVARAMAADGETFFADGAVGAIHPGPAAYDRITDAIAQEVASCP